jgi:uncharacterized protein YbbC (DUF1343 family)
MWFDQTGMPWVRPSPNLPTLTSALVYPSLVAFEGSNVSIGRGTSEPFQRFGAAWMNTARIAELLNGRRLPGVRFVADSFTPVNPGDAKYNGVRVPGVRIEVANRDLVQSGRMSASILWAILQTNRDSLRISTRAFDERLGSAALREAIFSGADPDVAFDVQGFAVDRFLRSAQPFRLYR